jgi:hypothetical protein
MRHFRFAYDPPEPERHVERIGFRAQCPKPYTSKAAPRAFEDPRDQESSDPASPKLWIHIEVDSPDLGRLRVRISIEPAHPDEARSDASRNQDLARTDQTD